MDTGIIILIVVLSFVIMALTGYFVYKYFFEGYYSSMHSELGDRTQGSYANYRGESEGSSSMAGHLINRMQKAKRHSNKAARNMQKAKYHLDNAQMHAQMS